MCNFNSIFIAFITWALSLYHTFKTNFLVRCGIQFKKYLSPFLTYLLHLAVFQIFLYNKSHTCITKVNYYCKYPCFIIFIFLIIVQRYTSCLLLFRLFENFSISCIFIVILWGGLILFYLPTLTLCIQNYQWYIYTSWYPQS